MKKILIITVVSFCFVIKANGFFINNSFVHQANNLKKNTSTMALDTAKYLREIVSSRVKFEQKELKVLLDDLKIEVKHYIVARGKKVGTLNGLTLYFEDSNVISYKLEHDIKAPAIFITFKEPISSFPQAASLLSKSHGTWLKGESLFYGNQQIKSIDTNGWNK